MRSFEYGLHCFRKHVNAVTELLVEVIEKLATLYYKISDEKNIEKEAKDTIIKYISEIAVYRYSLRAIVEETRKKAKRIEDREEAIRICVELIAYLREIRVYLDNIVDDIVERGVEESVHDEVKEAIGHIVAAIHHLVDTIESIKKEEIENEKGR